jgi:hypothetical protein
MTAMDITIHAHPVSDLAAAKAVYAALLGVPPQTDRNVLGLLEDR